MIKKIKKLLTHPETEYKKIVPFIRTKLYLAKNKIKIPKRYPDYERLKRDFNKLNPLLIHFGCGPRIIKDWINIDLAFTPYKNYLSSYGDLYPTEMRGSRKYFYELNIIETGLPIPENSVDCIFHEDFLEHLNQMEQIVFLSETLRVLKKGGIHRVNTPDLIEAMKKSDFKKGKDGVHIAEWNSHGHKDVLTKNYLREIALMVGYERIEFNTRNKSLSPYTPKEYRPGDDREENGNIFADLIK